MFTHFSKPSARRVVLAAFLCIGMAALMLGGAVAQCLDDPPSSSSDPAAAKLRAQCANQLKQLGIMFKMFANEHNGRYPEMDPRPGRLMFKPEDLSPEYMTDARVLVCPADKKVESDAPAVLIDDHSYFYLGFMTANEERALAMVEAYGAAAKDGKGFSEDFTVSAEDGKPGRIYKLREGAERFLMTDLNDPEGAAAMQGKIPVMIERPGHHKPGGGNVLYMDGRVAYMKYPGDFPMTKDFIKALEELDRLAPPVIGASKNMYNDFRHRVLED